MSASKSGAKPKTPDLPPGIYPDRYGYRVVAKANGSRREHRYPPDARVTSMVRWQEDTRAALRHEQPKPPTAGTLASDVARYREMVSAMPTFGQRMQHLDLWLTALGPTTPRARITAEPIAAVLNGWRLQHSAATCNKRRSALMHLWSRLDGKGARNPVRDVPKYRVADPLPRGRDQFLLDRRLKRAVRCRSRAVCRVLLWTGMRPVELQRAQRDDLDLRRKTVIVRTAKGGPARVIPLTPQAISAWGEFCAAVAWGDVPQAAPLNRWLKKATGLEVRVYDLRHAYGTALARSGARLDVIAALMGHSTLNLTRRYLLAAVTSDALSATARLGRKGG